MTESKTGESLVFNRVKQFLSGLAALKPFHRLQIIKQEGQVKNLQFILGREPASPGPFQDLRITAGGGICAGMKCMIVSAHNPMSQEPRFHA